MFKQIWLKRAYKCVYCNYIIHIKCYEKTIGKTICERFYTKNGIKRSEASSSVEHIPKINVETEEPFVLVPQSSSFPNEQSDRTSLNSDSQYVATPRSLVTNFISGIRQRKWNPHQADASSGQEFKFFHMCFHI